MKNVFKVLGIIALVAVIGFSMVSCKDDDSGGGGGGNSINWVGTWKMTESSNGNIPNPVPYFTLNADKSWTLNPGSNTSGTYWYDDPNPSLIGKPGIVLAIDENQNGSGIYLLYEIISGTEVKISSTGSPSGTYTKQ